MRDSDPSFIFFCSLRDGRLGLADAFSSHIFSDRKITKVLGVLFWKLDAWKPGFPETFSRTCR